MSNKLKIILIVAVVGIAGAATYLLTRSSGSGLLAYVPNDAVAVVRIDVKELAAVLEGNEKELKGMELWKVAGEKNMEPLSRVFSDMMKDPKSTGINFSNSAMFFMHKAQRGETNGLILKLKDKADFAKFIKNHAPAGSGTGNESGFEYVEFGTGLFVSWNDEVLLFVHQPAESKSYFADILARKNPGAKGNILLSKVEEGNALITAVMRLDDFFKGKNMGMSNPFPAGTAITASLKAKPGEIEAEMSMISGDKKALKELNFFKEKGKLGAYKNELFTEGDPYSGVAVSVEIPKLLDFIKRTKTSSGEVISDETVKEFLNALSGDFVLGMAIKEKKKPADQTEESDMNMEDYSDRVSDAIPYQLLLHVGLKDKAKFKDKLSGFFPAENGVYQIPMGFLSAWAAESGDHFVISMDKKLIQNIAQNGGKIKSNSRGLKIPDVCENAPLAMVSDTRKIEKIMDQSGLGSGPLMDFNILRSITGEQYVYMKDGEVKGKTILSDTKTHPLMLYFRLLNQIYKKRAEQMKEFEKMEEDLQEIPAPQPAD